MTETSDPAAQAPWTSFFPLLIPHPQEDALLLQSSAQGWRLPQVNAQPALWMEQFDEIQAQIRRELPFPYSFAIPRYAKWEWDKEERWAKFVWVLELLEPAPEPPVGSWVSGEHMPEVGFADPEQKRLALAFLAETEPPASRAPWARPGWFAEARNWIQTSLKELGREQTGPVVQLKIMGISAVLRTPTRSGPVYFKATADLPLFADEPQVMERLAQRFPGLIPRPIRRQPQKRWMLLDDFGENLRGQPLSTFANLLQEFGALQISTAHLSKELLAIGCLDRRIPDLESRITPLLHHPLSHAHGDGDVLKRLQELAPRLTRLCRLAAAEARLPDVLVHGDLHLGNAARRQDQGKDAFTIFDWSDASLAHPFLDMHLAYFSYPSASDQDLLRETYLSSWRQGFSDEVLQAEWALVRPLSALHQAVSYLYILLGQEELVHQEMADGLEMYLKMALNALEPGD